MAFPTGWGYYQSITIDNTKVPANATDFPVLVTRAHLHDDVVDPSGSNAAQADGGDVRFSTDTAGTTQLACEVVQFAHDTSTGAGDAQVQIWVKVPSLSSSVDTVIYIWYKTAGTDTQPAVTDTYGRNNVWDSNYLGVWHLEEDPSGSAPQMTDSTGAGNDGTSGGTMTSGDLVTAQISNGLDFDGTDDSIDVGDIDVTGAITISAWANITGTPVNQFVVNKNYDGSNVPYSLSINNGTIKGMAFFNGTWRVSGYTTDIRGAGDTYINGTYDGSTLKFYVDNALDASNSYSGSLPSNNSSTYIGTYLNDGAYLDGVLDEVRISDVDRGLNWITTEYNNQSSPNTFATAGTPVAVGGGGATGKSNPLSGPFGGPLAGPIGI